MSGGEDGPPAFEADKNSDESIERNSTGVEPAEGLESLHSVQNQCTVDNFSANNIVDSGVSPQVAADREVRQSSDAQASSEAVPEHVNAEETESKESSDVSRVSAVGQSIYSGTGQLLNAVKAWRGEAPQGTESDAPRVAAETSGTPDVCQTNSASADNAEGKDPSDVSRVAAAVGQSIYSSTGQLLNAVKAWRGETTQQNEKDMSNEEVEASAFFAAVAAKRKKVEASVALDDGNASEDPSQQPKEAAQASPQMLCTEKAESVDSAEVSRVAAVGQSIYSGTGQLFNAVKAWRGAAPDQNEKEAFQKSGEAGEAIDDDRPIEELSQNVEKDLPTNSQARSLSAEHGEGKGISDVSRATSIGQSIYSGTGQLLSAVQAWRGEVPQQNERDALKEAAEASASQDDCSASEKPLQKVEMAVDAPPASSQISSLSKSIYASGEQLLSNVHAWREKKEVTTPSKPSTPPSSNVDGSKEVEQEALSRTQRVAGGQFQDNGDPYGEKATSAHTDEINDAPEAEASEACDDQQEARAVDVKREVDVSSNTEENLSAVGVTRERRSTTDEWEMLEEEERVKCWRCGLLVSPQIDAIEEHSLVCSRPSLPEIEPGGIAAEKESQESESKELTSQPMVEIEPNKSKSEHETQEDLQDSEAPTSSTATTTNPQTTSTAATALTRSEGRLTLGPVDQALAVPLQQPAATSFAISTAAITAVTRLKKLGLEAKDRAYQHYWGVALPEGGEVNIQMAHTALFLSCDAVNKLQDSEVLGLRSDSIGDESTWALLRLEAEGVFKLKSVVSGRCLVTLLDEAGIAHICLGGTDEGPVAEWRITKSTSGRFFSFQNIASGRYMAGKSAGVLDGTEIEAVEVANADCEWVVAAVMPPQGAGEEQPPKKSGLVEALTPDLDAYVLYSRVESTMERSILMVLDPVLHGIPAVGIASAKEDARRLRAEHGSAEAAIAAVRAKIDVDEAPAGLSQKILMKASELLVLRFLPFVGAGAYLSFTLYTRLRLAALVAEIYGVDTEDAEVQSMLLFCIAPDGSAAAGPELDHACLEEGRIDETQGSQKGVRNVVVGSARILAHTLVRQVLKRATGWKTAADLYDLAAAVAAEGYTHVCGDGSTAETPKQVEGGQQATLRRATLLFKPSLNKTVRPFTLAMLCIGAALPSVASALRQILKVVTPIFGLQITVACVVCVLTTIGVAASIKRYEILDFASEVAYEHPELISSIVCVVQSALPLKAAFDATATIIDGCRRSLIRFGQSDVAGGGLLVLMLGVWLWLRILQRCFAEPNTPAARGESTAAQKSLVGMFLLLGACDVLGADGFALHSWIRFGSLDSHHWFFGLLSAVALECQMRLITSLRDRDTLLRILGATRMMSLALVLFLGGLTASVGFLVSRSEFSRFVDTLAPPPQVMTVILTLRRQCHMHALLIGIGLGVLWHTPPFRVLELPFRFLGVGVGVYATAIVAITFEEYRGPLLEPNGGRWLLLFPETSEKAFEQAMKVWEQFSQEAANKVIAQGTQAVGKSVISKALDCAASYWSTAPLEQMATAAVEVVDKVEGH